MEGDVEAYLATLSEERRRELAQVREVILRNLPKGFEEGVQYGAIGYFVPHALYPKGYHCDPKQPLGFANLAARKNYLTLSLMTLYANPQLRQWFEAETAKAGKKLKMGKACIEFKKADDLALEALGRVVAKVSAVDYIATVEASRKRS